MTLLEPNEHISHVAVVLHGVAHALRLPRDHKDLIRELKTHGLEVGDDTPRGYVTTKGRYVERMET